MKKYSVPLALFVFALLFFGFYSLLGIDLHHDGIMFKAAVDAANGKAVFREFFSQYGVLSPLLQGAFIKIFGAELIVLKLLTALFYAASVVVYYQICCRFLPAKEWWYRVLCLLMYFWLSADSCVTAHPWASVYALFFLLLAIYFAIRYFDDPEKNSSSDIACGVCAGLMFGFRQPCGLTAFLSAAAIAVIYFSCERKNALRFALRFFSAAAVLLGIYAIVITCYGAWKDYLIQTWTQAFSFALRRGSGGGSYGEITTNFFPFITGDRGFIDAVFALFPLLTLGLLGRLFLSGKWKEQRSLVALIIFALGAWHQYYPVPCMRHLYWASVPMMIIFVLVIRALISKKAVKGKICAAVLIAVLLVPMVFRGYFSVLRVRSISKRSTADVPGVRGLLLFPHEKNIAEIFGALRTHLPEPLKKRGVFNHTPDGVWAVVMPDCKFDHPLFCRLTECGYPDYDREAYRFCMEKRPVVVSSVWNTLPGYVLINAVTYQGVNYFFLMPER